MMPASSQQALLDVEVSLLQESGQMTILCRIESCTVQQSVFLDEFDEFDALWIYDPIFNGHEDCRDADAAC